MFKTYLILTLRNLKIHAVASAINIFGLMLGLSIASLVLLFVVNELTYDTYHKDADRIYRLTTQMDFGSATAVDFGVNGLLGPYLIKNYPKVNNQCRVSDEKKISFFTDNNSYDELIYYADSSYFSILTHRFIYGDPKTALTEPFSLVLTKTLAEKYYGSENPLGKVIKADNDHLYKITAVIEDVPDNTHFNFDMLSSFESLYILGGADNNIDGWGINNPRFGTYIKLAENYSEEELNIELPKIVEKYLSENPNIKITIGVQALLDLHLKHDNNYNMNRIIMFSVIGIFVLLIACINFINLRTAQAANRLMEVGVKKVFGAQRKQLIQQFLFESLLISIISTLCAVALSELFLPFFNDFVQKDLRFSYIMYWQLGVGLVILALIVGLLAGSYPAFYMSSFKPISALKGKFIVGSGKASFRNALVVLQFIISIALICCSLTINLQLRYLSKADLGIETENIIAISLFTDNDIIDGNQLKNELSIIPELNKISVVGGAPFLMYSSGEIIDEESGKPSGVFLQHIDESYIEMMGVEILEGRKFTGNMKSEAENIIVNETFVKHQNWENAIGKSVLMGRGEKQLKYRVIGIVKDHHYTSMHRKILPMVMQYSNEYVYHILAKYNPGTQVIAREKAQKVCNEFDPSWKAELTYLKQEIESKYEEDRRIGNMFVFITILAIFIASIGFFGLASYKAKQKTKEIGIKKILGASMGEIVKSLAFDFIKLILISSLFAIPLSWYYLNTWLQNFAYHVSLSWWIFAVSTLIALFICMLTVAKVSIKAASANPVDTINYE